MFLFKELQKCCPPGIELRDFRLGGDADDPTACCVMIAHLNKLEHGRKEPIRSNRYGMGSEILNVVHNDPATVVFWKDGTKTVVKCQDGDTYSKETGLALCIAKKVLGNKGNFNNVFKKWCKENDT